MLKIKVCGNKFQDNMQLVCETKPDYMGFIFYPVSPRFCTSISPEIITVLTENEIIPVSVFVNENFEKLVETCNTNQIKTVQLHGSESAEYCEKLKKLGFTIIKVIPVLDSISMRLTKNYYAAADFLLFDTNTKKHGGSGQKFNHKLLTEIAIEKPFFLSGGISPEDAEYLKNLKIQNFYGIDINSRFETEPGIKNIAQVETFINQIRK